MREEVIVQKVIAVVVVLILNAAFMVFLSQFIPGKEGSLKDQSEMTLDEREALYRLHETKDEYDEPDCFVCDIGVVGLILLGIVFLVSLCM